MSGIWNHHKKNHQLITFHSLASGLQSRDVLKGLKGKRINKECQKLKLVFSNNHGETELKILKRNAKKKKKKAGKTMTRCENLG